MTFPSFGAFDPWKVKLVPSLVQGKTRSCLIERHCLVSDKKTRAQNNISQEIFFFIGIYLPNQLCSAKAHLVDDARQLQRQSMTKGYVRDIWCTLENPNLALIIFTP